MPVEYRRALMELQAEQQEQRAEA